MMTMTYFCIVSASNLSYSEESMTLWSNYVYHELHTLIDFNPIPG